LDASTLSVAVRVRICLGQTIFAVMMVMVSAPLGVT
jgi:hypothetical protein